MKSTYVAPCVAYTSPCKHVRELDPPQTLQTTFSTSGGIDFYQHFSLSTSSTFLIQNSMLGQREFGWSHQQLDQGRLTNSRFILRKTGRKACFAQVSKVNERKWHCVHHACGANREIIWVTIKGSIYIPILKANVDLNFNIHLPSLTCQIFLNSVLQEVNKHDLFGCCKFSGLEIQTWDKNVLYFCT